MIFFLLLTQTLFAAPPKVVQITAGLHHNCALLDTGEVKCWGYNGIYGTLGMGLTVLGLGRTPNDLEKWASISLGKSRAKYVAAGGNHTCVVLDDDSVKCWGENGLGDLGLGDNRSRGQKSTDMGDSLPPVSLGNGTKVKKIALGDHSTCALFDDGKLKCWGDNSKGQLGLGHRKTLGLHPEEMGNALPYVDLGAQSMAQDVCLGAQHTCALLTSKDVKCWGGNYEGVLGREQSSDAVVGATLGSMGDSLQPINLGKDQKVSRLACGKHHTCAVLEDGKVKCWGYNESGRLGLGDSNSRGVKPGSMGDKLPFVDLGRQQFTKRIAAGSGHTCAILASRLIKCWGFNYFGQLGLGHDQMMGTVPVTMGDKLPFVDLGTLTGAREIVMGKDHGCALLWDGSVKCWGYNQFGQLGVGDSEHRGLTPFDMGDALKAVIQ